MGDSSWLVMTLRGNINREPQGRKDLGYRATRGADTIRLVKEKYPDAGELAHIVKRSNLIPTRGSGRKLGYYFGQVNFHISRVSFLHHFRFYDCCRELLK